jgi:hypothetical protein
MKFLIENGKPRFVLGEEFGIWRKHRLGPCTERDSISFQQK